MATQRGGQSPVQAALQQVTGPVLFVCEWRRVIRNSDCATGDHFSWTHLRCATRETIPWRRMVVNISLCISSNYCKLVYNIVRLI